MDTIQINKWYYDVPQDRFLEFIHKYPLVPFFVDGESQYLSGVTFRSNNGKLEVEYDSQNYLWREGSLSEAIDENYNVDFIVHSTSFAIFVRNLGFKAIDELIITLAATNSQLK